MAVTIFFSYSHRDEALRDRLEVHLAMLKRQGVVSVWHDRRIVAGDDFSRTISEELESANIILLLVSPEFVASDYCYNIEMKRAVQRAEQGSARVIPVILRACDWHGAPFGKLTAAPKDGRPIVLWPDLDVAFLDVVNAIKSAAQNTIDPPAQPRLAPSVPAQPISPSLPRSSNLRLRKNFDDADRDGHCDEAYEYILKFFRASLQELQSRNAAIKTTFRINDANSCIAMVYRDGKTVAQCRIGRGGVLRRGITYSTSIRSDNSFNECLTVEADDQGLYLKPMMAMGTMAGMEQSRMTLEGAAECFWTKLISPLQ